MATTPEIEKGWMPPKVDWPPESTVTGRLQSQRARGATRVAVTPLDQQRMNGKPYIRCKSWQTQYRCLSALN
jgi:hypothetical protein